MEEEEEEGRRRSRRRRWRRSLERGLRRETNKNPALSRNMISRKKEVGKEKGKSRMKY